MIYGQFHKRRVPEGSSAGLYQGMVMPYPGLTNKHVMKPQNKANFVNTREKAFESRVDPEP